jgi:murein tripeptide amidase MpaA
MHIDSAFDGGNIEVLDASDPANVRLAIRPDNYSRYFQWFAFRLTGARGKACTLKIENAGGAAYLQGWRNGYRAAASSDRITWRRLDTSYDGKALTIRVTPDADALWIGYFALYTAEQHERLLGRCAADPRVSLEVLGRTLDGRAMDMMTLGTGKRVAWVVGRQHPGETMASYFIDGFMERLLDRGDKVATQLLEQITFHVVPNMNPDGSRRGHLRCNAAGVDLNREWSEPSMAKSPEVFLVRERMVASGVDLFLDVHGDEATPHNFIIGTMGVPNQTAAMTQLFHDYRAALVAASPDYHTHNGHWSRETGAVNLAIGSSYVANRFGCLSMTFEMPFKDEDDSADAAEGWSPQRSHRLGRANLDAFAAVAPRLR